MPRKTKPENTLRDPAGASLTLNVLRAQARQVLDLADSFEQFRAELESTRHERDVLAIQVAQLESELAKLKG